MPTYPLLDIVLWVVIHHDVQIKLPVAQSTELALLYFCHAEVCKLCFYRAFKAFDDEVRLASAILAQPYVYSWRL